MVPDDIMITQKYITQSEDETIRLAEKLGGALQGHEIIGLVGDLGVGKTVFTKGIASGLGLDDAGHVCSPSYTLINIYEARVPIIHIDLYRMESLEEITDLGWEEYISNGVVIIEWADRLPALEDAVYVYLKMTNKQGRRITIRSAPYLKLNQR